MNIPNSILQNIKTQKISKKRVGHSHFSISLTGLKTCVQSRVKVVQFKWTQSHLGVSPWKIEELKYVFFFIFYSKQRPFSLKAFTENNLISTALE